MASFVLEAKAVTDECSDSVFAARLTASVNFCFQQRFGRRSAEDCRAAARFRVDEGLRPPCGAIEIGTNSINPCSEGCARFCRESTAMHTLADWVDQSSLTRLTATFVLVLLAAVVSHMVKRHLWRTFVSGAETRFHFQYEKLLLIPHRRIRRLACRRANHSRSLIILGLWA